MIEPISYNTRGVQGRVTVWKYERISSKLTAEIYQSVCIRHNASEIKVIELLDGSIFHKYPNKPAIIVNHSDGKLYTTKKELAEYGRRSCQHQATFPLKLLYYDKQYRELVQGVNRREMSLGEFFLLSAIEVCDSVIKHGVVVTLTKTGMSEYEGKPVFGFAIKIENKRRGTRILLGSGMVQVFDELGNSYKTNSDRSLRIRFNGEDISYFYVIGLKAGSNIAIRGECETRPILKDKIDFEFKLRFEQANDMDLASPLCLRVDEVD